MKSERTTNTEYVFVTSLAKVNQCNGGTSNSIDDSLIGKFLRARHDMPALRQQSALPPHCEQSTWVACLVAKPELELPKNVGAAPSSMQRSK